MDLTADDLKKVRGSPRTLIIGTFCQYLLPLVALLSFKILQPGPEIVRGMILLASAPGGGISNYYTYLARANVALSVVLTAISCLAAALTMPLLLRAFESVLAKRIDFHVPLALLSGQLLLLLVLPVLIGILIRRSYPQFVIRWDRTFRLIGMVALACLIGFILIQTRELFLSNWLQIGKAAALFVLLSMILGYLVGFVFRLNRKNSFTLLIEYGVRNVAIATTAAVVILKRTEFATFGATYFLIEAGLILNRYLS